MTVVENLAHVKQKIHQAELTYRCQAPVRLVAVSKQQSIDHIMQAAAAGQRDFAENYLQEALPKIAKLDKQLIWHFIGRIQSNKTKQIAEQFNWVHGVDRLTIGQRLSKHRPQILPPLNICVQLNISQESSKGGVTSTAVKSLLIELMELPNISVRGLMVIPAVHEQFAEQLAVYEEAAAIFYKLQASGLALDTLSMGMSADFVAAIAAGSTMVRIGSAIFGERR